MPMPAHAVKLCLVLLILALTHPAHAQCQQCAPLDGAERAELGLFRLAAEQESGVAQSSNVPPSPAYSKFAERSYEQVNEMYNLGLRTLKWQIMASNVLMVLVVIVTLSGVAMSAYQLWISGRIAMMNAVVGREQGTDIGMGASRLEISSGKVSVQTAFVGIIVLAISAALLLLFVREVYTIHPLNVPSAADLLKH